MATEKTLILTSLQVNQKINRIAHEIYENHFEEDELIMICIAGNGTELAKRIMVVLSEISPLKLQLIELHINKKEPLKSIETGELRNANIRGKIVLLVDDVLASGKTLAYGAKFILDYPVKRLCTAVLVDRKHRLYPIRADYVGLSLATTLKEHISVNLNKGKEAVYLD